MHSIHNGSRVLAYDSRLFVNDLETPCITLMRPATVVCRYGCVCDYGSGPVRYPDLVDIVFDHRPDHVSYGHFTDRVKVENNE